MAEQAQRSTIQQYMNDFVTGPAWVPTAPGPSGHARPQGNRLEDSPVVKWSLDLFDRLHPVHANRRALRAVKADPAGQVVVTMRDGVVPGLEGARDALAAAGYAVSLEAGDERAVLSVVNYNGSTLTYTVTARVYTQPAASLADVYRNVGHRYAAIEIDTRGRMRRRTPAGAGRRAIQRDCLHELRKALLW